MIRTETDAAVSSMREVATGRSPCTTEGEVLQRSLDPLSLGPMMRL